MLRSVAVRVSKQRKWRLCGSLEALSRNLLNEEKGTEGTDSKVGPTRSVCHHGLKC